MTAAELAALVPIGVLAGLIVAFREQLPTWATVSCVALDATAFAFVVWHMLR
jgi:hypothetical protein